MENQQRKAVSNWKRGFWPDITDLASARKTGRFGAWAAFTVAAVTSFVVLLGQFGIEVMNIDTWAMVDATLAAGLGLGIWRMSRVCAITMLLLYILQRITEWSEFGFRNPLMPVILGTLLLNGIRGTFAYHRYKRGHSSTGIAQGV